MQSGRTDPLVNQVCKNRLLLISYCLFNCCQSCFFLILFFFWNGSTKERHKTLWFSVESRARVFIDLEVKTEARINKENKVGEKKTHQSLNQMQHVTHNLSSKLNFMQT